MSLYIEKSDEELTTDAFPSPPRDNNENNQNNSGDDGDAKENQFEEEIRTNASHTHTRKTKNRGFTRVKRTSPPTAYASIININNSSDVHVGAKITIHNRSEQDKEKQNVIETSAIRALRINPNPLTREDLLFVATHIDERWRDVGRALKFSDGQMAKFFHDHKDYGIKEVIYQLLLDWYQNEPSHATVKNLASILWDQKQRDTVKRWCEKI